MVRSSAKLKWILAIFSVFTILSLAALIIWLIRLDEKIITQLKIGKFLPPTEYYSAPPEYFAKMKISKDYFKNLFKDKGYRLRDSEQKLFPGDWTFLTAEKCQNLVPQAASCIGYVKKQILPDEASSIQIIVFDQEEMLIATWPKEKVELEPDLIAQYIGSEPIMHKHVPLGEIPTQCLNAVLAIEDSKFLEHSGVSYTGILRAAFKNTFGGAVKQGGSTITQQMVKNYFLSNERTIKRKIHEFFMSLILETRASKDQILETYLNIIYLGQDGPFQIRGISAATEYYFSKKVTDLSLPECALIAAIVNGPGIYDPFRKPDNAQKRLKLVLSKMLDLEFITKSDYESALQYSLPSYNKVSVVETAPYYINAVNKQIFNLGLDPQGLKVFTGLVLSSQKAAQDSLREQLTKLEGQIKNKKLNEPLEGLVLVSDNNTGLVNAAVGGRNYKMTQFNRAIDAHRQVGSIIKPIVFLAALLSNEDLGKTYDPLTTLEDKKFSFKYDKKNWSPDNYGNKYYQSVPLYFALKNSLNSATAQLGLEIGLDKIIYTARKLGAHSRLEPLPALTLGAFELYPMEVLTMYTNIARMGKLTDLSFIKTIYNDQYEVIFDYKAHSREELEPDPFAILISMMKQTILSGTAKSAFVNGFTIPSAGKTGTTSDNKDAWFAGFTPYVTSVVWIGYDSNTSHGLTGATGALPIWTSLMKAITKYHPNEDFSWPETTEKKLVTEGDSSVELIFKKEN